MTDLATKGLLPPSDQRPAHVAIIMDGNGRWAADRGLPRLEGHRRGAEVVRDITEFNRELGIRYLTLYSFSTENWRRPAEEVTGLMRFLEEFCRDECSRLVANQIKLQVIGNMNRLPSSTQRELQHACDATAHCNAMILSLAIDYGGREEIIQAVQAIARAVDAHELKSTEISEHTVSSFLSTHNMPDPDLVIRTSGEIRVSNFLLWQIAYAELYFTDVRWPEFGRSHYVEALSVFARRKRRFGGVDAS